MKRTLVTLALLATLGAGRAYAERDQEFFEAGLDSLISFQDRTTELTVADNFTYYQLQTLLASRDLFEKSLAVDEGNISARNFYALTMFMEATQPKIGDCERECLLEETVREYERAFALNDSAKTHMDLDEGNVMLQHRTSQIRAYGLLGDTKNAFEQASLAKRYYPDDSTIDGLFQDTIKLHKQELLSEGDHKELGYFFLETGSLEDAEAQAYSLMQTDPEEGRKLYGLVKVEQGLEAQRQGDRNGFFDLKSGISTLEGVETNPEVALGLGKAYIGTADLVNAIRILEPHKGFDEAVYTLADAYSRLGAYLQSGKVSAKHSAEFEDAGISLNDGELYQERALDLVRQAVELTPENPVYRNQLERLEGRK